jgi:hypothetical protein
MRQVRGQDLTTMLANLNAENVPLSSRTLPLRRAGSEWGVPTYVGTGTPENATLYDVIYCDFDMYDVEKQLEKITGKQRQRDVYHAGSNTSSVFIDWFRSQSCADETVMI